MALKCSGKTDIYDDFYAPAMMGEGWLNSTTLYGSVINGVTTITSIVFNDIWSLMTKDIMPEYIKINGTKYTWVVDYVNKNGDVTNAHVNGLPITINNIFFTVTGGTKTEPEKALTTLTLYDKDDTRSDSLDYVCYLKSEGIKPNFSLSEEDGFEINGKNSITAEITDGSGMMNIPDIIVNGATYRFVWTLGTESYTQDIIAKDGSASATFTPPKSWCNQIPNNGAEPKYQYVMDPDENYLFCTVSILVDGKTANEWAESYGKNERYSQKFVFPVAAEDALPTITSVTLTDSNGVVPGSWKTFVQHLSNVAIYAITASGAYSSTIKAIEMVLMDGDTTLADVSGSLTSLPKTTAINVYGTFDITITVTDSRQRTAEKSATVTFVPYAAPTIKSIASERCTENGTIDNDGTYAMLSCKPVYSPCNGNNTYHVYVSYKLSSANEYGAEQEVTSFPVKIGSGDFNTDFSYDVRYRIADQFNSEIFVDFISTAVMLMHFLREGRGVAFGQKATIEDAVDFGFNAIFRKNVAFEVNNKFYTIEDIINAITNLTSHDKLDWIDGKQRDFTDYISGRVEYISTNGGYVDTGYKVVSGTKVVLCYKIDDSTKNDFFAYFGTESKLFSDDEFCLLHQENANVFQPDIASGLMSIINSSNYEDPSKDKHIVEMTNTAKAQFSIDGKSETLTNSKAAVDSTYTLALSACNSDAAFAKAKMNIYYCKIYTGDTLMRDFVPFVRNGVYGLYDKVTKGFYTSANDTAFTGGDLV